MTVLDERGYTFPNEKCRSVGRGTAQEGRPEAAEEARHALGAVNMTEHFAEGDGIGVGLSAGKSAICAAESSQASSLVSITRLGDART